MSSRAYRSAAVERDAALIFAGFDPPHPIEWHHAPPLELRAFELINGRKIYTPDENDPRFLVPMRPAGHKDQTFGKSKATSAGGDLHAIAHAKRVAVNAAFHRKVMAAKAEGEPRPRQKGKRPWPKRSMRRREARA